MMQQNTKILNLKFSATNAEGLKAKLPNIQLLAGSTGRIEIFAKTVLGICPVPLGPLMRLPFVGDLWAAQLTPTGAVVTARGGFGGPGSLDCHAYVEWEVPVGVASAQTAPMHNPVPLIAIGAAIVVVMVILAWAIKSISMSVVAVVEAAGEVIKEIGPIGTLLLIVGGVILAVAVLGATKPGRRRRVNE